MLVLQEPDFQENEFMYDDFDLEENIASCKCFVKTVWMITVGSSQWTKLLVFTVMQQQQKKTIE